MTVAGTAGNLGWDPAGTASVEPLEALKEAGWPLDGIPPHETINWLLSKLGAAGVRRFDTVEALIAARICGTFTAEPETVGLVYPESTGFGTTGAFPRLSEQWAIAGSATDVGLWSDGEYLWMAHGTLGIYHVRKRSRIDGSVVLDGGPSLVYPLIATAGGIVFGVSDDGAGKPRLCAFDRDTLALLDYIDLPSVATPYAIDTDGVYVAVGAGHKVHLYRFIGVAFIVGGGSGGEFDEYDHGANVLSVSLTGSKLIISGVAGTGGNQIRVFSYDQAVGTLTLDHSIAHAGIAAVEAHATDGERLFTSSDQDGDGHTLVAFPGSISNPGAWKLWGYNPGPSIYSITVSEDRIWIGTGEGILGFLLDAFRADYAASLSEGVLRDTIVWGGGAGKPITALAFDFDGLFALGADDGTSHHLLRRFRLTNQPRLYAVQRRSGVGAPPTVHRANHALIQPVR